MKTIKLTETQLELLVEVLASAKLEVNFASRKRHVMFLPDLFRTLTEHEKDLDSLLETCKMSLKAEDT